MTAGRDDHRPAGADRPAAAPPAGRLGSGLRRVLLLPRVAALAVHAPRNTGVAWERFWSSVHATGDGGDVLWDSSSGDEPVRYRELAQRYFDPALPVIDLGCGNGRFTHALVGVGRPPSGWTSRRQRWSWRPASTPAIRSDPREGHRRPANRPGAAGSVRRVQTIRSATPCATSSDGRRSAGTSTRTTSTTAARTRRLARASPVGRRSGGRAPRRARREDHDKREHPEQHHDLEHTPHQPPRLELRRKRRLGRRRREGVVRSRHPSSLAGADAGAIPTRAVDLHALVARDLDARAERARLDQLQVDAGLQRREVRRAPAQQTGQTNSRYSSTRPRVISAEASPRRQPPAPPGCCLQLDDLVGRCRSNQRSCPRPARACARTRPSGAPARCGRTRHDAPASRGPRRRSPSTASSRRASARRGARPLPHLVVVEPVQLLVWRRPVDLAVRSRR